jgi:CheY-like chemotaxis protein
LLSALRELPCYRATPAVACTAYVLPGDRERYLAFGFDAHIRKPFDPRRLQEILKALVARRVAA